MNPVLKLCPSCKKKSKSIGYKRGQEKTPSQQICTSTQENTQHQVEPRLYTGELIKCFTDHDLVTYRPSHRCTSIWNDIPGQMYCRLGANLSQLFERGDPIIKLCL